MKILILHKSNRIYDEAIDLFDHYDKDGKPRSRFNYLEIDKKIERLEKEDD